MLAAAILAYLVLQFAIGAWVSRRVASEDDYLVAGRRLGYPLATFSIFATWFGAETCIGAAGRAYGGGFTLASPEPFGYGICLLLAGVVFAAPLWRRKLTTLADLYRERYSVATERCAAVLLVPGSVLWAAAQIRGFAHVLADAAPFAPGAAVAVAAGLCILYTAFGGLLADAVTDVVQGVVLVLGLVVLAVVAGARVGGAEALVAGALRRAAAAPAEAVPLLDVLEAWAVPICGSMVATELVSRMIAARSEGVARNATLLAGGMYVAVGALPLLVGASAAAFVPELADAEQVLPATARALLPGAVYVVFAATIISAVLSTVDSTLLCASGLLSHNLLVPALGIRGERGRVRVARLGVASFGAVAWWLASRAGGVSELVEQASGIAGAGALVTAAFALFTRFGGPAAAITSLVASVAAYAAAALGGLAHPFLASLAVALGGYVVVGLAERARAPRRA